MKISSRIAYQSKFGKPNFIVAINFFTIISLYRILYMLEISFVEYSSVDSFLAKLCLQKDLDIIDKLKIVYFIHIFGLLLINI